MGAFRGQKHPSEAKKGMKELIYQKKVFNESFSATSKAGPIRFELRPQVRIQQLPRSFYVHSMREAPKKPAKRDS